MWALASSYLIGSIPTAYLVVRGLKRVDIRTVGSGNVGATNVTRVAGVWAGVAVLCLDMLKGAVATLGLARWMVDAPTVTGQLACGLMAVVGHCFPIALGFRGGKGVATTIGVVLTTMPAVASVCLLIWLISFAMWRYVSVSSLAAAGTLPTTQLLTHAPWSDVCLGAILAGLIILRHRDNIERLRRGTEHRMGHQRMKGG